MVISAVVSLRGVEREGGGPRVKPEDDEKGGWGMTKGERGRDCRALLAMTDNFVSSRGVSRRDNTRQQNSIDINNVS